MDRTKSLSAEVMEKYASVGRLPENNFVPTYWYEEFCTCNEHHAWIIIRNKVQMELLNFDYLINPAAFGGVFNAYSELGSIFVKPLLRKARTGIRETTLIDKLKQLRKKNAKDEFEEELEDPEDRLMYVGSVMKVGQLSEEAGRKMVFFYTNNFRDEYRVQLKDKREGVRKEIDLFFKNIRRSSMATFGPKEYRLDNDLVAAVRRAKVRKNARPPKRLFIEHDLVWADSCHVHLRIGKQTKDHTFHDVKIGFNLTIYENLDETGNLSFPSDFANSRLFWDHFISPSFSDWLDEQEEEEDEFSDLALDMNFSLGVSLQTIERGKRDAERRRTLPDGSLAPTVNKKVPGKSVDVYEPLFDNYAQQIRPPAAVYLAPITTGRQRRLYSVSESETNEDDPTYLELVGTESETPSGDDLDQTEKSEHIYENIPAPPRRVETFEHIYENVPPVTLKADISTDSQFESIDHVFLDDKFKPPKNHS